MLLLHLVTFFQRPLLSGLERLKKTRRDFIFFSGVRNVKVVSPLWLMVGAKTTEDDLQAKTNALWEEDPVHLVAAGYQNLLENPRTGAAEEAAKAR